MELGFVRVRALASPGNLRQLRFLGDSGACHVAAHDGAVAGDSYFSGRAGWASGSADGRATGGISRSLAGDGAAALDCGVAPLVGRDVLGIGRVNALVARPSDVL